jgi:hypothetical protein
MVDYVCVLALCCRSGPSMYVAKDAGAAQAFRRGESMVDLMQKPLADRVPKSAGAAAGINPTKKPVVLGGSREMSFVPQGGRGRGSKQRGRGGRGGRGRHRG